MSYTLIVAPMGVKFGTEVPSGPLLHAKKISPQSVQRVAPAGRKTSKLASE